MFGPPSLVRSLPFVLIFLALLWPSPAWAADHALRLPQSRAWSRDDNAAGEPLVHFTLAEPESAEVVGTLGIFPFLAGCDFVGDDYSKLYALSVYPDHKLYTIDTVTGLATIVGDAVPFGSEIWRGISWSPADGLLYASATNLSLNTNALYTIDPATGAATPVTALGDGEYTSLAIDCTGRAYACDVVADTLLAIDLATGDSHVVGSLDFDAVFAGGLDFDDSTGVLYMAAVEGETFSSELRIVNTTTGGTVRVGRIGSESLASLLAIEEPCAAAPVLGACCDEAAGTCTENVDIAACITLGYRFLADGTCGDFDPPCGLAPGACCYADGTCALYAAPDCQTKAPGDTNCDGAVTFADIDPFVAALGGALVYDLVAPDCNIANADCNLDGTIDWNDIDPFVGRLGKPLDVFPATFLGGFSDCSACPCVVRCNGDPELETCGGATNNGCNGDPVLFEPIVCGQTKCGTAWFNGDDRDSDWYELNLDAPASITVTLHAEFDAYVGLAEQYLVGVPGCDNLSGILEPGNVPAACTDGVAQSVCLPAGTYYVFVAPLFGALVPCPGDYQLTVTCTPCVLPPGACCFFPSGACQDNLTEFECIAIAGTWQGGDTTCGDITCPTPPANDVCTGAAPIALADGVATVLLDNTYALDDAPPECPGDNNAAPYKGLWYSVVGNGRAYTVTTCSLGTVATDTAVQVWCGCEFTGCAGGNENDDTCDLFPFGGASTFTWCTAPDHTYYILVGGQYPESFGEIELTVTAADTPCTATPTEACTTCRVTCPPDATTENEPCITDPNFPGFNDGCNLDPPAFENLTCGQTVCGTAFYDGEVRDTDWYKLVLAEPAELTLTAEAEYELALGLIEQINPGAPGCNNITGSINPFAVVLKCEPAVVTTACLPAGTYYVFIAPAFGLPTDCAAYTLTATCSPCPPAYCPAGSELCDEHITDVELVGQFSNASVCGDDGYQDWTTVSGTVQPEQLYTVNIANGPPAYPQDQCRVWVDWNQDQDFNDPGEEYFAAPLDPERTAFRATVAVPASAAAGSTRMRIRIGWLGFMSPCGSEFYMGEVEDYTLHVAPR